MMTSQRVWLVLGVVVVLLLAACGAPAAPATQDQARAAAGYTVLTPEELAGMLEHKDFTLVNVHVPYDGELEQTDLFIPFDIISEQLDALPGKDDPIVLYCRSGNMSTTAAKALVGLGYTHVMELQGGMVAWDAAGYELLQKPQ